MKPRIRKRRTVVAATILSPLLAISVPGHSRADVPVTPKHCTTTLCFSFLSQRYELESATTTFDASAQTEVVLLRFSGGIALEFRASAPQPISRCGSTSVNSIPLLYPPWSNDNGCREVTAVLRGSQNDAAVAAISPTIWGLEEFPNGNWVSGKAQRLGPPVHLCQAKPGSMRLVKCT